VKLTIGIDPGIERTGIGLVHYDKQKYYLVDKFLVKTSSKMAHSERLVVLHDQLSVILAQFTIEHAGG
jgi:crossover junction endodeoxyribonuclease RuvC